ncbi:glycosyltransferase family 2 protein [Halomonas sp. BC2]|uniref:glycosyltransferase family 2 protein n=1 Tax=Halomonas sp. BC2 TaxID=1670449 RepID=UPI0009BE3F6C|nr:glycosyltransferase family 2 protein [Halomonas sp. BC2]
MTLVSVAITGYNISEYVEKALESVASQTYPHLEIIFVDDGSKDDTFAKASRFLKFAQKRVLVSQYNKAAGGARNTAINIATGKYITFLDGDDWLAPEAIEKLVKKAEEAPVQAVFSNRSVFYEKNGAKKFDPLFQEVSGLSIAEYPDAKKRIAIHGKLFDRQFLVDQKVYFPEKMSVEDFVFNYDFLVKAERVSAIPDNTYFYRKRKGDNKSLTQDRLTQHSLSSRFRQILLTQEIAARPEFKRKFPDANEVRTNFKHRLVRHIFALPKEKDAQQLEAAFMMLKAFVKEHEPLIVRNVNKQVAEMYKAIAHGSLEDAVVAIKKYETIRNSVNG